MGSLTSSLIVRLVDDVSGKAGRISKALALAEKQTRALAAASKAGLSDRMATQLQRLGAGTREIERVTAAWQSYSRAQGLAASSSNWTKAQVRGVKEWERANLAAIRSVQAAQRGPAAKSGAGPQRDGEGGGSGGVLALARGYVGPAVAAYAVKSAVTKSAEAERAITRIGITADATAEQLRDVGKTAFNIAQEVAMPYARVVSGLDTLVAQGRSLEDSMAFLPSVARTASAAGAEVDDIAKTADAVGRNFRIAGRDMQGAFDIMAAGGKAGTFELKDQARYLASLAPSAAAVGFAGQKGLSDLVSMLQVIRKGTGSSEEAVSSLSNIFQKMESEETTKRFKKFGVDLPAAMTKARKEGKNLVATFEDLTNTALKGDLSKIPQLFNDMEFARGMRALMSMRGEWQKLSGSIQSTSGGAVERDLVKVTDNVQAKLDRLANAYEKRMRQIGAIASDILVPVSDKIDEVTVGKNSKLNTARDLLVRDAIERSAKHELLTGERYGLTDERRRQVDARKETMGQELAAERLATYERQIAAKEAELKAVEDRSRGAGKARQDAILGPRRKAVDDLKAERDSFVALQREVLELKLRTAEAQGAQDRARTRMTAAAAPMPILRNSFGFGPHGVGQQGPSEVPMIAPLPPSRPGSLPQAAPMLKNFDDIFGAAEAKAKTAGETIQTALEVTAQPKIDTSQIDAALAKTNQLRSALDGIGGAAAGAASRSTGVVGRTMRGIHADGD
jgi:TP901 family phage tail tape measure protein